ncbi:MAG TPA: GNAT family N-acetyltransferase [Tepidisphaeraceae bacterium]|jgi:GNAT superfamily N-acetyltransferase
MASELKIKELEDDDAIAAVFDLAVVLRPHLKPQTFIAQVRAQQQEGYRLIAGFAEARPVVLAGFRRPTTLARGPHLFVDDLVTAPTEQGKGYATAMLRRLAGIARESGLSRIWLDSRDTAKTFYQQVGFTLHSSVPCWIDVDRL